MANAIPANAMAQVRAMLPKRRQSMAQRVYRLRNVRPGFARTAFVAIAGASERAKPVLRRKKVAASMAFADPLPTIRIPTKNAGAARVMAQAFANNTTAYLVRANPSVCPGIVSTVFAVVTSVRAGVMPVRKPKRAKGTTASAGPLLMAETSTANARPENVMAAEHAVKRKLH